MKKNILIASMILSLVACGRPGGEVMELGDMADLEVAYSENEVAAVSYLWSPPLAEEADIKFKQPVDFGKKIIRTAGANIQVELLKNSIDSITTLVKTFGGYVVSSNQYDSYSQLDGSMQIRVKSVFLDSLLEKVLNEAIYVQHQNISSQDVTEEFVDIEIRLKNKRAVEEQYLSILKSAKTIKDILSVQNELRVIREEIETKEGRLKYLSNQVAFSTINLSLYQLKDSVAEAPGKSFFAKILDGLAGGWKSLLAVIVALSYAWPFVLIIAAGGYLLVRLIRKRRVLARR